MSILNNTTGLEEILSMVNALPEAGGSGGVKIATGSISIGSIAYYAEIVHNLGENPNYFCLCSESNTSNSFFGLINTTLGISQGCSINSWTKAAIISDVENDYFPSGCLVAIQYVDANTCRIGYASMDGGTSRNLRPFATCNWTVGVID